MMADQGANETTVRSGPVGIRGWLLLPALITVLFPLQSLFLVFGPTVQPWVNRPTGGALLLAGLAGCYALFDKKATYPLIFITMMSLMMLACVVIVSIPTLRWGAPWSYDLLIGPILGGAILIAYMLRSKRCAPPSRTGLTHAAASVGWVRREAP
jgi:hypothetical protein